MRLKRHLVLPGLRTGKLLASSWLSELSRAPTLAHTAPVNRTEKERGEAQEGSERKHTILPRDPYDPMTRDQLKTYAHHSAQDSI